jgi:hypothetical protein
MGGSELEKESCVNKPRERFLLSILNTLSATPEARPQVYVGVIVGACNCNTSARLSGVRA